MLGERGFARRLRAENLGDAAAGNAADTEGDVEREGAGGDGRDLGHSMWIAETHHGALAEVLGDLLDRAVEVGDARVLLVLFVLLGSLCHGHLPPRSRAR